LASGERGIDGLSAREDAQVQSTPGEGDGRRMNLSQAAELASIGSGFCGCR
jgi:hypothetical protein